MWSLLVAVLALGWTIYAYYYPQAAPEAVSPSTPSSVPAPAPSSAVTSLASTSPASPLRNPDDPVRSAGSWATATWTKLSGRYERDRHDRSVWSLMLAWGLLTGLMLWFIADGMRVLAMPLMQLFYLHYYSPSLNAWGVVACIIGAVLATAAAVIIRLEQG